LIAGSSTGSGGLAIFAAILAAGRACPSAALAALSSAVVRKVESEALNVIDPLYTAIAPSAM
jgi:hypothetical protein